MSSYHNFKKAQNDLADFEKKFTQLQAKWKLLMKYTNLFHTEVTDPFALSKRLSELKQQATQLIRYLDAQTKGGIRQYAQKKRDRGGAAYGHFGHIKGHNKKLRRKLSGLIRDINLIKIIVEKSSRNQQRTLVTGIAAYADNEASQMKKWGTNQDLGDPITLLVMLTALIKQLLRKK